VNGFCHQCGNCCENIWLEHSPDQILEQLEIIEEYVAAGNEYPAEVANVTSYLFVLEYWSHKDNDRWECSFFNTETRQCEAHDLRPPICEGYPWYSKGPGDKELENKCGYWYDIPTSEWPDRVKVLPILETA
jgi:Fe-S-cluster containining protein